MGVLYVVVVIGMFFSPRVRGMDVRHEPVSEPRDAEAGQDGEALLASRRTDIRRGQRRAFHRLSQDDDWTTRPNNRSASVRRGGGQFGQVAMDGAHRHRSLSDGAGHSLCGAVAHVAGGEDARQAAFER